MFIPGWDDLSDVEPLDLDDNPEVKAAFEQAGLGQIPQDHETRMTLAADILRAYNHS